MNPRESLRARPDAPAQAGPLGGDPMTRRDFVKAGVLVGAGAAVSAGLIIHARTGEITNESRGEASIRKIPKRETVPGGDGADPLVRMQAELEPAMAKPVEEREWMMIIDTRKCIGCHACTVACIAENKLPPGVVYRPVITEEIGTYPNLALRFTPRPCMQCDNPSCTPVCPVKATWKRPDGIVAIDYDKCIGCGYCITACPYNARTRDHGEYYTDGTPAVQPYERAPSHEYGKAWDRAGHASPVGNARKCQFCLHRLERGLLPQCVTTCIGRATYFGDARDPASLVSELAARPNSVRLLKEMGTDPDVVYLI